MEPRLFLNLTVNVSSGGGSVDEGSAYHIGFSATPDGSLVDEHVTGFTVDWGDGSAETFDADTTDATHVYADGPNSFDITVHASGEGYYSGTLINTDGSSGDSVTVNNVDPTLSIDAADPGSITMGEEAVFSLAHSDPGDDTISAWTIDWGDGSAVEQIDGSPATVAHTYATPGQYNISGTATDEDGTYAASTTAEVKYKYNIVHNDDNIRVGEDTGQVRGFVTDMTADRRGKGGVSVTIKITHAAMDAGIITAIPGQTADSQGNYEFTVTSDDDGLWKFDVTPKAGTSSDKKGGDVSMKAELDGAQTKTFQIHVKDGF